MTVSDAASQLAELQHACNLRELGGLETADGHVVRSGLIFRAASLHKLSDAQLAALEALGIALVIDLRTNKERTHQPSRYAGEIWTRDYGHSGGDLSQTWGRPDLSAAQSKALMQDIYRAMPEEQADAYAAMFRAIAAGRLPLLFHCTAGKDRTGVGAALLLEILGVPRAAIETDYLRTGVTLVRGLAEVRATLLRIGLPPMSDEVLGPILGVDLDYLDIMLRTIDEDYGSVAGYLDQRLSIDAAMVDSIRRQLLEKPAS